MLLVAGVYEVPLGVHRPFGLRNGQVRNGNDIVVSLAGWYNSRGERLGWGSLSVGDFRRIREELPRDEVFVVVDYSLIFETNNPFRQQMESRVYFAELDEEDFVPLSLHKMRPVELSNIATWMIFPQGFSLNEHIFYDMKKSARNTVEAIRSKLPAVTTPPYIFKMYFDEINIIDC